MILLYLVSFYNIAKSYQFSFLCQSKEFYNLERYYSSEDTIRVGTQLRFQFYDEDSNRVGTLYECGLYLRFYGIQIYKKSPEKMYSSISIESYEFWNIQ